ncbi:SMEK domain-containing protein [Serratia oryzae]|uniref:SMEK domain-containing protein n=1 Tax=Serratia oryzae TaxID=2034155 RepID=UPI0012E24D6C|nr:SMEK domain-containing protein [Serratia oryzae]
MLERTNQNDEITHALSTLSTSISFKSKQMMFDDNRVMETILPALLNELYGYSLRDLNLERHNYPAIDLGDTFKGKAVQITADGSKSKMVDTIGMLEKHGLNNIYVDITFLIISNDQKISYQKQGYNITIINLSDIAKDICSLPTDRFEPIYNYCESQFRSYFPNNKQSIFQPIISPSKDPGEVLSNFLNCNGIDLSDSWYKATVNDVRDNLIELKNILAQLNDDQRWFIFKVMDWSIKHNKDDMNEYCIVPLSHMTTGMHNTRDDYKVKNTADSLESIKILYYNEESWKYDFRHFSISFIRKIEDFNYFCGICVFLNANNKSSNLKDIIIDCDFSFIN